MTFYERFEQLVALILSAVIAVVIVVAVIELVEIVALILVNEPLNPMQSDAFQLVLGMIMRLLIALEFKHSIVKVAMRRESIIQVMTVILIALIALARKFVILDANTRARSPRWPAHCWRWAWPTGWCANQTAATAAAPDTAPK